MKNVYLMGTLGEKFGPVWEAECDTIAEIFQLIDCQNVGFKKYMLDCTEQGTNFSIRAGKDLIEFAEELALNIQEEDVYITDVPAGSEGWGKIIAAVAIVAFIYFTGGFGAGAAGGGGGGGAAAGGFWGAGGATAAAGGGLNLAGQVLFSIALSLAISGINELLMPEPNSGGAGSNHFFNGPVNTLKQGQPVPLLYGELVVGGAPISVSFTKRPITSAGFVYNSANTVLGDFDAISSLNQEDLGVAS